MLFIIICCVWNIIGVHLVYRLFKKKHMLFDDRFTMTMCMTAAMIHSFSVALHLELVVASLNKFLFLCPILIGIWIGWKFGSILKNPARLTGIYNGSIGGLMGTMLGAVIQNPSLCSIPVVSDGVIALNMYILSIFFTIVHFKIAVFIRYSFTI
ncbi:hypothetical protein BTO28_08355 [Domibacillus epiphyticus]|uniref:Uncharacterized protein n=1 Tax=Domibacillus epiphyticus TaxID=1714355 RepID=A0A1V2A854_9BACI|nr:hypothetical protein BTO28_08355 [Domibacillus epiphyticus]